MNLETKHLIPYLPYGLNILLEDRKVKILIGLESPYKTNNNFYIKAELREPGGTYRQTHSMCLTEATTYMCKPLLVPMSALTQEELRAAGFHSHIDFLTHEKMDPIGTPQKSGAPYLMVQYLFSKHYDVFGLIEQGLAFDKNLFKPTAV